MKCLKSTKKTYGKSTEIRLSNAEKVFPCRYNRIRPHDIPKIVEDKGRFINLKDMQKLMKLQSDIYEGKHGSKWDILVERKNGKIKVGFM